MQSEVDALDLACDVLLVVFWYVDKYQLETWQMQSWLLEKSENMCIITAFREFKQGRLFPSDL